MNEQDLKHIIEATLLAAGKPVTTQQLLDLFEERERPTPEMFQTAIGMLMVDYESRGIEVIEVASGWRIQVRQRAAEVVSRLWQERPAKYSRALLETLALIAYRQPITRSEIEEIRGVSISSTIMRTLQERGWIRTVGHREVPGRPELLGTTREFLDYFGLKSLDQLPTLAELKDVETIGVQLELPADQAQSEGGEGEATAEGGEAVTADATSEGATGEQSGDAEGGNDAAASESTGEIEASGEAATSEASAEQSDQQSSDAETELASESEEHILAEAESDAEADHDSDDGSDDDESADQTELSAEDADSDSDDDVDDDADGNIDDADDDTELLADGDEDSDASPPMVAADAEQNDRTRIGEPPSES